VVKLLRSLPVTSSPLLPTSIVSYAWRTKQRVLLDNAAEAPKFCSDDYIARTRPKSVLCLPILRQTELVGLLYLENNLVTGAFTVAQLEVLELLASQAAISLENALLLAREHAARVAAQEEERRAAFLAEASVLLGGSLDYERVLRQLAELSVRELADVCLIDLVEGGEIKRLAGTHADPAKQALLEKLQARYPPRAGSPQPAARVMQTGEPMLAQELTDAELRASGVDDDHLRLVRALGFRSALCVPLIARGQTFGALTLVSERAERLYGRADLDLARELAHRAAMAIDNARLHRQTVEALHLREEFLTVASHELRTPMTSLTFAVHSMRGGGRSARPRGPEDMDKRVELAWRQVQRLNRLIGELLDISRFEAGRLSLDLAEVDLGALAREVVQRFALDLARSRYSVSVLGSAPEVGRWDRSRLDQVISNLLSNAIKFGAGKPIEILVGQEAGSARLVVKDLGIGIDPAAQARIFERFERAVSTRHYGGLGLGLYICREIVEAHGGSIHVASQPGTGSTFTVELPCAGAGSAGERDP